MLEWVFQGMVERLALFYGWSVLHLPDNRPDENIAGAGERWRLLHPGFPDLLLLRPPELLLWELKTDRGYADARQRRWLEQFAALDQVMAGLLGVAGRAGEPVGVVETEHGRVWPTIETAVFRPRDWDFIKHRLARGRYYVEPSFDPRRPAHEPGSKRA